MLGILKLIECSKYVKLPSRFTNASVLETSAVAAIGMVVVFGPTTVASKSI